MSAEYLKPRLDKWFDLETAQTLRRCLDGYDELPPEIKQQLENIAIGQALRMMGLESHLIEYPTSANT